MNTKKLNLGENMTEKQKHILAKNLRKYRLKNNLLQKDVAKYLNVVLSTYSQYETGKSNPDYETLIKLSRLYKVSIDELVGNKDENFESTKNLVTKRIGDVIVQFENTKDMEKKIEVIEKVLKVLENGNEKK